MNKRAILSIVVRTIFLGFIVTWVAGGNDNALILHLPVFLITLPLLYLGKKNDEFFALDALINGVFVLYGVLFAIAPDVALPTSLFGIDKLFHAMGGFALCWTAIVFYRTRIHDRDTMLITAMLVTLAIGAGWEVLEYIAWLMPPPWNIPVHEINDTMLDLVADSLGALFAALMARIRGVSRV